MGKYGRGHIGKTFNDGKLTVVDGGDKIKCVKVKCSVCAEDYELFGDGIFETQYFSLARGKFPCGCSKNIMWTLKQYKVKINRKIKTENLPVDFVGFVETATSPSRTPIKLQCNRLMKEFTISSIHDFFSGVGNQGLPYTVDEELSRYNENNPEYTVWNTGNRDSFGNAIGGFHCKTCENSGFESVFEILLSELFVGTIPCYCSAGKKGICGNHVVEVSKRRLHEENLEGVSVLYAYKKAKDWCVVFLCDVHGIYSRAYSDCKRIGSHCLKCSPSLTGYNTTKKGYLYLLDIQPQSCVILGYGITNNLSRRITDHKRNLKSIGATITNIQVFEGPGTAVLAVENAIKALHPTGLIDCEGFRRESISIDMKDKVLEKCSKLKELDNVDKVI